MKLSSDLNQIYWIRGRAADSISKFLCLKENHHHSFSLWSSSVPMGWGRLKFRVFPPQPSPDRPWSALHRGMICSLHQEVMRFSKIWNSCNCKIQILFTEKPMFHSWGTNTWLLQGSGTITFIFFPTLLRVHLDIIYLFHNHLSLCIIPQVFTVCDHWGHLLQFDSPANEQDAVLFSDQSFFCPLLFLLWLTWSLWCRSRSGTRCKCLHLPTSCCSHWRLSAISTSPITSAEEDLILPHSFHVEVLEHNELDGDYCGSKHSLWRTMEVIYIKSTHYVILEPEDGWSRAPGSPYSIAVCHKESHHEIVLNQPRYISQLVSSSVVV